MKRIVPVIVLALSMVIPLSAETPREETWEFLSTTTIGAKAFRDAHPEWDGRGVLVAVCDTGVDLNLRGLLTTSDGQPKILDARVFSEDGRIDLEAAVRSKDERGEALHGKDGKWLYGFEKLPLQPSAPEKVLVGYFEEAEFKNSDLEDLNGNGKKDDVYGLVAFEAGEGSAKRWAAFVDTDGDGDLAGEAELGDFSRTRKAFSLRGRDTHATAESARFALNLDPEEKKAALYVDAGSHGTHVAGIAAGYRIDGQEGYDGVAPGAQILAMKLGDSRFAGGATNSGSMVSAWRYAVKKAAELKMPLVIQMSYGTGGENLGSSASEKLLNQLLEENPGVVATLSAGNEGPGLSTGGMPARMKNGLAVAAVLAKTTAKDLYGAELAQDEMFSFSSRGGEAGKPDIACPGFAASTVPAFDRGKNVMRGTSMAAPQAAGAVALLMSAAKASGLTVRRDWVTASLKRSAKPVAGYGPFDYGAGLVDIPAAWEVYRALAKGDPAEPVLFEAEAECPDRKDRKGPAVYWRGFVPADETLELSVSPDWPEGASAEFKARYYRAFDFEAGAEWLRLRTGSHYIKAEQSAKVRFGFDAARLTKPGLYQTTISCWAKGSPRAAGPDLAIPVAVVVPHDLSSGGPTSLQVTDLKPAKLHRIFFRVPGSAGALALELEIPGDAKGTVSAALFDPQGRQGWGGSLRPENRRIRKALGRRELEPGVYELTLYANYANLAPASVSARIQSLPFAVSLPEKSGVKLRMGKVPEASLRLATALAEPLRGKAEAKVAGVLSEKREGLSSDTYSRTFSVLPGEDSVEFDFELSPDDWGLFTDIAVQVLDKEGQILVQDGLGYRRSSLEFRAPKNSDPKATYTLKVSAAAADPDSKPKWTLGLRELHRYADPVKAKISQGKGEGVVLYPDREAELSVTLETMPPALPGGASWLLEGEIKDSRQETLRLPFEVLLTPEN